MALTLITEKQLAEKLGYKYSSFRVIFCKNPEKFPPSRKLGTRRVWIESEVDAWICENTGVSGI